MAKAKPDDGTSGEDALAQAEARRAAKIAAAQRVWREGAYIEARGAKLSSDRADELVEAMEVLGKTRGHFAADAEAVRQYTATEAAYARGAGDAAAEAKELELLKGTEADYNAKLAQLRGRRSELLYAKPAERAALRQHMDELARQHPHLFGV
ncbi:MAG: hypothetical protein U0804_16050 [Gemmataceae bacterium]